MTDRLRRSLPPRLVVPLVLLLLSGILWLPVRNTQHTPPAETAPVEALPVKTVRTEPPPSRLFLAGERIGAIPSSADSCPRVVEAVFPTGRQMPGRQTPGFTESASSSASSPVPGPFRPRGPILMTGYPEPLPPIPLPPVGQPAVSEPSGRPPGMSKASRPAPPAAPAPRPGGG